MWRGSELQAMQEKQKVDSTPSVFHNQGNTRLDFYSWDESLLYGQESAPYLKAGITCGSESRSSLTTQLIF